VEEEEEEVEVTGDRAEVRGGLWIGIVQAATPTTLRTRQLAMFALFLSLKVVLVEDSPADTTADLAGGAREVGKIGGPGTGTAPSVLHIISLQRQLASSATSRSPTILNLMPSREVAVVVVVEEADDEDEGKLTTDQGTGPAAIATHTTLRRTSSALSAIAQRRHRISNTLSAMIQRKNIEE